MLDILKDFCALLAITAFLVMILFVASAVEKTPVELVMAALAM